MKSYLLKINKILISEPDPAFSRRAKIIFENLAFSGREKILEVGCGRGFYLKTLIDIWPDIEVTGIDLNEKYLAVAKDFIGNNKVKLIKADATHLPFVDNSFDRIIATEILEHIPDDQKAVSEIHRVLKPGGIVMVSVPNKNYPFLWDPLNWILERVFRWHVPSNIWWLAGIWADHVRLYSEKELKDKMVKTRFKTEKTWKATHYCFPCSHFLLYGIGKNLVEKGIFGNMNRFKNNGRDSFLKKLVLWPIKKIDSLNIKANEKYSSVNLIFKLTK